MVLRSIKETAARLGLAEATLANWRVQGKGPAFVKIGSKVVYPDENIDAFITSGHRRATSETTEAA
jgi:predicted DNA-binding transcriptional regulator AlpA